MQLAQTRMRLGAPFTSALTACRFTFQRRRVTLCACEMLFPNCGPLPQTSHICAIALLQICRCFAPPLSLPGQTQAGTGGTRPMRTLQACRILSIAGKYARGQARHSPDAAGLVHPPHIKTVFKPNAARHIRSRAWAVEPIRLYALTLKLPICPLCVMPLECYSTLNCSA